MFTGIIETVGTITNITRDRGNLDITLRSNITDELKVDQSVAHNGICLTIVSIAADEYTVTAIAETISKTTIAEWEVGRLINLERAMKLGDRLDGHIVQGHVDQVAECISVAEAEGSRYYTFRYDVGPGNLTIEKGSITVDGVSLTVVDSGTDRFSVAIIPYTFENTGFKELQPGSKVNLEFDVIGKYVAKLQSFRK